MPECRYCEFTCDGEDAIREHLFDEHEREELGRIDRKRVDQYVAAHELDESRETETNRPTVEQSTDRHPFGEGRGDTALSHGRWELDDVRDLSTDEIVDNLGELGIETTAASFRERAEDVDSAETLSEQWLDQFGVEPVGHDQDFVWMAAWVLWERWVPEIPNTERILDLHMQGYDRLDDGERVEACRQWLTAWEFSSAVTPDEVTALEEAQCHLPADVSLESMVRDLDTALATLGEDDPVWVEQRIEFCRELCDRYPDSSRELLLDARHAIAESLARAGRRSECRAELESIVEAYPDDPLAYFELADSHWRDAPEEAARDDLDRAAELYRLAREHDFEDTERVAERLDEVRARRSGTDECDEE